MTLAIYSSMLTTIKGKQDINQLKEKFFKAGGIITKLPFIPSYYPSKKIRWHYADKPDRPEWK